MDNEELENLDINRNTPGAELYVGLVAPVGVDLRTLHSHLQASLSRLNYKVKEIKLSDWIKNNTCTVRTENDYEKLLSLMETGSKCREISKRGDFLALAGIYELSDYRKKTFGTYDDEAESSAEDPHEHRECNCSEKNKSGPKAGDYICYVFNQLKRPEEVELLRWVYGSSFYLIGAYSSVVTRKMNLARRIETTSEDILQEDRFNKAQDLINFDYSEPVEHDFGQSIQRTFPHADVFFDEGDQDLSSKVNRFIELIFCEPFHSPTKDEQGMCLAKSAAYRSADLARQIGAAITTERGEIISIGCNDAARSEGGQYWVDDSDVDDKRDFRLGFDSNDRAKRSLLTNLLDKLSEQLPGQNFDIKDLVNKAVSKENRLGSADLFDVIEYFRSVHAEMAALMDAARRGISVAGATMYATTFPCHECAKHIVAAGIKRLIYIEPYPKSKALILFEDAISLDVPDEKKTLFKSFVGVAPRRYAELFDLGKLKRKTSTGDKKNWLVKDPRLRRQELESVYIMKETFFNLLFEQLANTVKEKLQTQEGI
jgi:deoxycytidylate deaminase